MNTAHGPVTRERCPVRADGRVPSRFSTAVNRIKRRLFPAVARRSRAAGGSLSASGYSKKSRSCHDVGFTKTLTVSSVEELDTRSMQWSARPYDILAPVGSHVQDNQGREGGSHKQARGGRRHPRCSDKTKLLKYLRSHAKVCKCCNCRNSHYPPILG